MLDDLFKRIEHLVQQSVECMLKQLLKPLKRALKVPIVGFMNTVGNAYERVFLEEWEGAVRGTK